MFKQIDWKKKLNIGAMFGGAFTIYIIIQGKNITSEKPLWENVALIFISFLSALIFINLFYWPKIKKQMTEKDE